MKSAKSYFQSRRLRIALGLAVTIALLTWAIRDVSPAAVLKAARMARLEWLIIGLFAFLGSLSARAWRWGTLLESKHDPGPFMVRQQAVFIGFAGNCVLPLNAGDVIRAAVLQRFAAVPIGVGIGSIVAERLLDGVVVFAFLLAGLVFSGVREPSFISVACVAGGIVLFSGGGLIAASYPGQISRFSERLSGAIGLSRFSPRVGHGVASLLSGLDALRDLRRCIIALSQSVCMWALIAITYWSVLVAFHISSPGIPGALFVTGVATLGVAIPSSPGYFGPFEAAVRAALQVYDVAPDTIVAYALTLHLMVFASLVGIGLFCAMRMGLSLTDLSRPDAKGDGSQAAPLGSTIEGGKEFVSPIPPTKLVDRSDPFLHAEATPISHAAAGRRIRASE